MPENPQCDGCGEQTSGVVTHFDGDQLQAKYCSGCEQLRDIRGIEPAEHEQYKLQEYKP